MNDQHDELTPEQRAQSQWLTPSWLAEAMWARAKVHSPKYVLEPCAGRGALILPIDEGVHVTAVEIDPENVKILAAIEPRIDVYEMDFLVEAAEIGAAAQMMGGQFDLGILNAPYEENRDLAFLIDTFALCKRVIFLSRVQLLHRKKPWVEFWSRPDVNLTWRADVLPRPKFGGKYTPMDEYVVVEVEHGPQQEKIGYARIVNPRLLTEKP